MNDASPKPPLNLRDMAPLLQVYDMPVSVRFYRDILGFSVGQSSGEGDDVDWMLLELGGIELMLNTAYEKEYRPQSQEPQRIRWHGDTALYFGCADVEGAYRYLREKGVELQSPAITGYGWKAIEFRDPDGYLLCFHCPLTAEEQ